MPGKTLRYRRSRVVSIACGAILCALAAASTADDHTPQLDREDVVLGLLVAVPAALGAVVGAVLLVGEVWDYVCTASGHEFVEEPPGSAEWRCTGVPRGTLPE